MTDTTLAIDEVDPSGALAETAEAALEAGSTRADFLKQVAVGASGMTIAAGLIGASSAGAAASTGSPAQDIEILNYALTLEYLERDFYFGATKSTRITGELNTFARIVYKHEFIHVVAIRRTIQALGGTPVAKPNFNFRGTNRTPKAFGATALALEETGVRAYAGQVTRLDNPAVLEAAAAIHSVEARHAAWMRNILNRKNTNAGPFAAPSAFDKPATMAEVLKIVGDTNFIVS